MRKNSLLGLSEGYYHSGTLRGTKDNADLFTIILLQHCIKTLCPL